jgi:hypothetical protein
MYSFIGLEALVIAGKEKGKAIPVTGCEGP